PRVRVGAPPHGLSSHPRAPDHGAPGGLPARSRRRMVNLRRGIPGGGRCLPEGTDMKALLTARPGFTFALALALVVLSAPGAKPDSARDVRRMAEAALAFLSSLDAGQRGEAAFMFDSDERLRFHFIPVESFPRQGLRIRDMSEPQRERAHALLQAGLSSRGYLTAQQIIELEGILRDLEGESRRLARDPEEYLLSVFGTPSPGGTWGWRFEGHHLSLNFTIVGGEAVASAPAFLGANPAEVREGPRRGL